MGTCSGVLFFCSPHHIIGLLLPILVSYAVPPEFLVSQPFGCTGCMFEWSHFFFYYNIFFPGLEHWVDPFVAFSWSLLASPLLQGSSHLFQFQALVLYLVLTCKLLASGC